MNHNNQNNNDIIWNADNLYCNAKVEIYEDESHEFKQFQIKTFTDICNQIRIFSKYITAYLNSNSGYLYLGISNDGLIKGIHLPPESFNELILQMQHMIDSYDDHVVEGKFIQFKYIEVYDIDNSLNDLYVFVIYVRKGLDDCVYTTPFKDETTKDYAVYVKMNGTTKKIEGESLYKYIKKKMKNYVYKKLISK